MFSFVIKVSLEAAKVSNGKQTPKHHTYTYIKKQAKYLWSGNHNTDQRIQSNDKTAKATDLPSTRTNQVPALPDSKDLIKVKILEN